MNIGIFTDCYLPTKNGVTTSVLQAKEGLERRGHHVRIFTVTTPYYEENDSTVYRVPSLPFDSRIELRIGLIQPRTIDRIIHRERLHIFHTHSEFSLGWAAKRAARRLHRPLVHTIHTMYPEYRHYLFGGRLISAKMIQRFLTSFLRNYNAVICPSLKIHRYMTSFLSSPGMVIVGNGVSKERFHPERLTSDERVRHRQTLGLHPSDNVMLYVGRIAREKRVMALLKGLIPILRQNSAYKAVFVGDGHDMKAFRNLVEKERISRQVIFTGYIEWEYMPKVYGISDVFVTASLSETHPMTLIEAAMCGLPIIARYDESILGLVKGEYNGYLVDSEALLADRVVELLNNDRQRHMFSKNSLLISKCLTIEIHVKQLEAVYQRVLKNYRTLLKKKRNVL